MQPDTVATLKENFRQLSYESFKVQSSKNRSKFVCKKGTFCKSGHTHTHTHTHTLYSYTTATSTLPDINALAFGPL